MAIHISANGADRDSQKFEEVCESKLIAAPWSYFPSTHEQLGMPTLPRIKFDAQDPAQEAHTSRGADPECQSVDECPRDVEVRFGGTLY
jgi:hypothetical protein